ncbi:MAG TPA: SRPBCC family protein [Solirubrobacterales bacterium]|nr:SRPBCC family protein [Solirubrobacterales bacterium]
MTGLWIAVAVLGVLLIAGMAGGFLLLAMGRLHLDLGWGHSLHELGPIEIRIAAPRDLVFEMIREPYLGHSPRGSSIEVLARGKDLAVAAHHTKVHFYTARTVESVKFEPPDRVGFRHLTGPVPHAVEEFVLAEADGDTELRYSGEVGIDFSFLGRIAGRRWVRPQWERAVREALEDLKRRAEALAERRRSRESRQPAPEQ